MSEIIFAGQTSVGKPLTPTEEGVLSNHVLDYLAWGNSFLYDLFAKNMNAIKAGVEVAKEKFNAQFKGLLAGDNEIGIQLIRPGQIMRTAATTEAANNTWSFSFAASGDYYVGYSTSNTTAANIDKEVLLLVLGVAFTQGTAPTVEELYWTIGQTTYPVSVIRAAWFADNKNQVRACRTHPMFLEPKQTVLVQSYSIAAATQELVLLGVAIGYGRFLRKTSYSSIAT